MAYLALARKWRPKIFSEVVGQSHVVQALSNALESGRVHHAFLFTGTRGVGKTTLARIFSKSLNCEEGTSAEPCQKCNTCLSIDEGRYVDLIEIDAASRTKVDDTREILDGVQYAPTTGKFKVYLIDEVHMLSGHSFNALLKTLEEPPEHVKFLFATTDPQKLPITVLSRCLQFNLRAMRPEQVENQLIKILTNEGIEFDQPALNAISKAADGSMRDGLSLLDQAIAQGGGAVKSDDVDNMLGTIKAEHTEGILKALSENDVDRIMQVIADMADNAVDFSVAIDDVLMQLYYVSLAQLAPNALPAADVNISVITSVADKLNQETVQLFYQVGLIGKRDIALAPSLRVGFEMTLLRMLAFDPVDSNSVSQPPISNSSIEPSKQTDNSLPIQNSSDEVAKPAEQVMASHEPPEVSLIQNLQAEQNVSSLQAQPTPTAIQPVLSENTSHQEQNTTLTQASQTRQLPDVDAPHEITQSTEKSVPTEPIKTQTPSAIAVTLAGNNEWGELIEQTNLVGLPKELAMNCACEKLSDDKIILSLSDKSKHLFKEDRVIDIQNALQQFMNKPVVVTLEVEESDKETPAECLDRLGFEQFEQTKESLHNDPGVKALMSEFGATINEQSIKSIDPISQ